MNLLFTYPETIVDGEGIRYSIYLAGCRHHCRGCQNPESWNPSAGTPLTPEKIEKMICEINANPLLDGITFSGGDPLYHPQEFLALVKQIKEATGQNIWCYTGCVLESELLSESPYRCDVTDALLSEIDVLVDGPFIEEEKSLQLAFRGSMNQRILRKQNGRFVVSET